jgi:acyl-CoA synthetase (AMP-forming)/AMP-acid ligase II
MGEVERRVRSNDPAFIQYTSGSTGNPKGVMLKHRAICSNIHAIGQALQINRNDVVVSWLPLYHDMGLIGALLFAVYWRIPLTLMSPTAFLMDPVRWLRALSDYRGTLSPAPNFGYARCVKRVHESEMEGIDLSSWRMALNGAEPVSLRILQEFSNKFAPCGFDERAFLPVYGLAEASLAVSFPPPGAPVHHEVVDRASLAEGAAVPSEGKGSIALVSVGTAIPGHEVIVTDDRGEELGERQVGHIVVRGPSLMAGYFKDPTITHSVLHSDMLWTGDLGYYADGHLFITGRVKDLIIVRGKNFYAEDVEVVAESVEGIRTGCCVAFGIYDEDKASDLLAIVGETKATDEAERVRIAEAVAALVQEECGLTVDEVALVDPGTIPKTSSGKRQRNLCRELYIRDELVQHRTSKLKLAWVFARSGMGFASAKAREILGRRRPSED